MIADPFFVFYEESPLEFLENKNTLRVKDAQLAESKLLLCGPLVQENSLFIFYK